MRIGHLPGRKVGPATRYVAGADSLKCFPHLLRLPPECRVLAQQAFYHLFDLRGKLEVAPSLSKGLEDAFPVKGEPGDHERNHVQQQCA